MSTEMQEASAAGSRHVHLPTKVIVSLRAGAVLALANILCVAILSWAWVSAKAEPKAISVTGSARKAIVSDLIVWNARVYVTAPDVPKAYEQLKPAVEKTLAHLKKEGLSDNEITTSSISTKKHFTKDSKGNDTDAVTSYELVQTVTISSGDVAKVAAIERRITELIKDGVMIESEAPSYLYTKLADLKVAMLAEATKDATVRAQQIAANSGAKLGSVRDARMGVMQINAIHSDEVRGYGVNDTSSYEKEITAVVSAKFALE